MGTRSEALRFYSDGDAGSGSRFEELTGGAMSSVSVVSLDDWIAEYCAGT